MASNPGSTILDLDIKELENAVRHLERSNRELQEYYETDKQQLLLDAIEENRRAITSKQARIEELKALLHKGKCPKDYIDPSILPHSSNSAANTNTTAAPQETQSAEESREEQQAQPQSMYL